jgi:hypothetical protein
MVEKNFGKLVVYIIRLDEIKTSLTHQDQVAKAQLQELLEMIREVVIFKNSLNFVRNTK